MPDDKEILASPEEWPPSCPIAPLIRYVGGRMEIGAYTGGGPFVLKGNVLTNLVRFNDFGFCEVLRYEDLDDLLGDGWAVANKEMSYDD